MVTDISLLDIDDCDFLSDKILRVIANGSPHLQEVMLRSCGTQYTPQGMKYLLSHCKEWKKFRYYDSHKFSDEILRTIFTAPNSLNHLSLMRTPLLTTATAIEILASSPSLTLLDVGNCPKVDMAAVESYLKAVKRTVKLEEFPGMPSQARLMQIMQQGMGLIPLDDQLEAHGMKRLY
eukprot:gene39230-48454_t